MCEYTDTHARMHVHVEVRGPSGAGPWELFTSALETLIGQGSHRLFPPQCWALLQVFCGFIDYAIALAPDCNSLCDLDIHSQTL